MTKTVALSKQRQQNDSGQRSSNRLLRQGVLGLVLGIAMMGVLITAGKMPGQATPTRPPNEEDYPSLGQVHIAVGQTHPPYNSNPPTSGWHYPTPADWGIYHEVLPDEELIHNLEHGGIWLSYRDENDTQTIQRLDALVGSFPDHVILTARPANDRPIAVAAWGHLLKLDGVDENAISDFISRYIRKGPENVP